MMDCHPTPQPRHTVVPDKGDPGDSSGYLSASPDPDEPLVFRFRFPYRGNMAIHDYDAISLENIRYRKAATGSDLKHQEFQPLTGSVEVREKETIELQLLTAEEGAAVTFKYQQLGPLR